MGGRTPGSAAAHPDGIGGFHVKCGAGSGGQGSPCSAFRPPVSPSFWWAVGVAVGVAVVQGGGQPVRIQNPPRRRPVLRHVRTRGDQHKSAGREWLVSGIKDHRYRSVTKSATPRQPTSMQQPCSGTQPAALAKQRPLDLPYTILSPPPPPPKCSDPAFCNLRFSGKLLTPKALKNILGLPRGGFFFSPVCLYSKYSEFCGEFH